MTAVRPETDETAHESMRSRHEMRVRDARGNSFDLMSSGRIWKRNEWRRIGLEKQRSAKELL